MKTNRRIVPVKDLELDAFTARHREVLLACAMRLCRHRNDAEDLVQDTLLRAYERYDSHFRSVSHDHQRARLIMTLHHRFIDQCRRRKREQAARQRALQLVPDSTAPEPPWDGTAPEPLWAQISSEQLRDTVIQLPDDLREAYELAAFDRLSYRNISERLGLSQNNIGGRLYRARCRLKDLLLDWVRKNGGGYDGN